MCALTYALFDSFCFTEALYTALKILWFWNEFMFSV